MTHVNMAGITRVLRAIVQMSFGRIDVGAKRRCQQMLKTVNLFKLSSEINGIHYIPDNRRLEEAKSLIASGQLEEESMKLYLIADWN